nr:immunoglobulin light chain junction region [Macaca mulatta]MPN96717.1 immunoglobulin light chain junction region [Macaca mulatta]MPN99141.1 immunoglobulin light chain junction region [Macaca mulatta]
CQHYYTAPYSF